ncbi:MAG: AAA family ATPase [Eubacteriales bacterium]|nr:AAA family ATPase [Eubacteriales bacterium]
MKTSKQVSIEWNLSMRSVNNLCINGRIPGAQKKGRTWMIPDDAVRPTDNRVKSGRYVKKRDSDELLPLPFGVADYQKCRTDYYCVDKTLMIKEFLDRKTPVSLFLRPDGFGKSMNVDMLQCFFEAKKEKTSQYFEDTAIWKCRGNYRAYQGKYPVIRISLSGVNGGTWERVLEKLAAVIRDESKRHYDILHSRKISEYDRAFIKRMMSYIPENYRAARGFDDSSRDTETTGKHSLHSGNAAESGPNEYELKTSLKRLSRMLAICYGRNPVIIVEDYDTPILKVSGVNGNENVKGELLRFLREFMKNTFRDNRHISYGIITGVLSSAANMENGSTIFSDLNGLEVYDSANDAYGRCFGFTQNEVYEMLRYYGISRKMSEIEEWFGGYGGETLYNPMGVIGYISNGCIPRVSWDNEDGNGNEFLEGLIYEKNAEICAKLIGLTEDERLTARIVPGNDFASSKINASGTLDAGDVGADYTWVPGYLLGSGYLTTVRIEVQNDGARMCELCVPNRGVKALFNGIVKRHMLAEGSLTNVIINDTAEGLYKKDYAGIPGLLAAFLENAISVTDDGTDEAFFSLIRGLHVLTDDYYRVKSEAVGAGKFDVCLMPKNAGAGYPGVVMVLMTKRELDEGALNRLSDEALIQTGSSRMLLDVSAGASAGVETNAVNEPGQPDIGGLIRLGVAFSGKKTIMKAYGV